MASEKNSKPKKSTNQKSSKSKSNVGKNQNKTNFEKRRIYNSKYRINKKYLDILYYMKSLQEYINEHYSNDEQFIFGKDYENDYLTFENFVKESLNHHFSKEIAEKIYKLGFM